MRIYIASSWKNQHAVEMLTQHLRDREHEVLSFVENNHGENTQKFTEGERKEMPFDEWVWSDKGRASFIYDTDGATLADMVCYIGPSGIDAWAEVGAAWSRGVPVVGLIAKGEQVGLMRRMVSCWCATFRELLSEVDSLSKASLIGGKFLAVDWPRRGR
jgi:hypothetical protein